MPYNTFINSKYLRTVISVTLLMTSAAWAVSSSPKVSDSGFREWKANYGKIIDMNEWQKNNPRPYTSYFPSAKADKMKEWHISLGPLGVSTLMHDRSWVDIFKACKELSPLELTDEFGLVKNTYEVTIAKAGGPADGILQKGDLILKMDGEELKEAQLTYLGMPLDNKNCRGLDISAGQMIDKAEGRGKIKLTVLRVPQSKKKSLHGALQGLRKWREIKSVKGDEFTVALNNIDIIKLTAGKGVKVESLTLANASGITFPLMNSGKKGGSKVNSNLAIPPGKWQLRGTLVSTKSINLTIEALARVELPEVFHSYIKEVELKLAKIGSFGSSFNPNGEKARNYSKMLAHRIAAQQAPDGSWSAKSYTTPAFYTSVCGLGLMSTNDPQYKNNIAKAARYVANSTWDKWSYTAGIRLTFLAEYYLKTADKAVIPGLKIHLAESHAYVCADYTAGHGTGPGYGGSGYIGGGGMIACGLAVASHTELASTEDKLLLDKMLERVQQIAPGGKVPYGRIGYPKKEAAAGQGGSCGTGPYFFASLIRGGAAHFTKTAAQRYAGAPWGSAENGHATQTLHFVWGALSSANCGKKSLIGSMNAYLWKFTLLRNFDGFTSENNYRTEYHSGDGVIGPPFWRTAGYLILMNAHKRNLAITGSPKYRSATFKETPLIYHRDSSIYNFVRRNWYLVEAALGTKAPRSLKSAIAKFDALPKNEQLGENLRKFMKTYAPRIAQDIMSVKTSNSINKAQLLELIYGVSIEASCTPDLVGGEDEYSDGLKEKQAATSTKKKKKKGKKTEAEKAAEAAAKKAAKKAFKAKKKQSDKDMAAGKSVVLNYLLNLRPFSILQKDVDGGKKSSGYHSALFEFADIQLTVSDPSGKYLKKPLSFTPQPSEGKVKKGEMGVDGFRYRIPMTTTAKGSFDVAVKYTLNGTPVSYKTKLYYPAKEARSYVPSLNRVKVRGTVTEDYRGTWSSRVKLSTGRVIGCEQSAAPVNFILAGTPCEFEISPTGGWAHNLRSVKKLKPDYRLAKPSSIKIEGDKYFGNIKALIDGDLKTSLRIGGAAEGAKARKSWAKGKETSITFTYSKPVTITSGICLRPVSSTGRATKFKAEAFIGGKWQVIREHTNFKFFNTLLAKSNKFRLSFTPSGNGVELAEINFHLAPAKRSATKIKQEYSW